MRRLRTSQRTSPLNTMPKYVITYLEGQDRLTDTIEGLTLGAAFDSWRARYPDATLVSLDSEGPESFMDRLYKHRILACEAHQEPSS
jgi:hypothetical protein